MEIPSFIQCKKQVTLPIVTLWDGLTYGFGSYLPETCQSALQCCIEEEAPFPEINSPNNLEIPESRLILCSISVQELTANISPFSNDGNGRNEVYKEVSEEIENI